MSDDPDHPSKADLAEGRTDLAGDRTMLANERTLAAWWRTAMAAVAAAIAFVKLYEGVEPQALIKGGASFLLVLALLVLWVAQRRYRRTARRIEAGELDRMSSGALTLGTGLLVLTAAAAGVAVWLL